MTTEERIIVTECEIGPSDLVLTINDSKGLAERKPLDQYYTDPVLAAAVVGRVQRFCEREGIKVRRVLEPSCGKGAFVVAARAYFPEAQVFTVDIDPAHNPDWIGDFLDFKPSEPFDLILGNPPFDPAQAHIEHARSMLAKDGMLWFLLRVGFAGGLERLNWFNVERPDRIEALVPRPSFLSDTNASDKSEYALWVWWEANFGRRRKPTYFEWLKWREKKVRAVGAKRPRVRKAVKPPAEAAE